jgi:hypothetical protein
VLDSYLDASQDEFVAPKPLNGDPDTGRLGGAPPPLLVALCDWLKTGPGFQPLADGPLKQGGTEMRTWYMPLIYLTALLPIGMLRAYSNRQLVRAARSFSVRACCGC